MPMHVKEIEQKITTYVATPDKTDYIHHGDVVYEFNHQDYSMHIHGDLGYYNYKWKATDNETFMQLLARFDDADYLLNKIASPCVFDLEKSINQTIKNIERYDMAENSELTTKICTQIKKLKHLNQDEFYTELYRIHPKLNFDTIEIYLDYSYQAALVVNIFKNNIQPRIKMKLRKDLSNE